MPYLGIYWLKLKKELLSYSKPDPQVRLTATFWEEAKLSKFETTIALFRYFWGRI